MRRGNPVPTGGIARRLVHIKFMTLVLRRGNPVNNMYSINHSKKTIMAKILNGSLLAHIRGTIGDVTIRQTASGPVAYIHRASRRKTYPQQQKQMDKFKRAAAYASAINHDPEKRKIYAANLKKGQSVYQKAMKEYLRRPEEDK
jgi:hypothetical protein